MSDNAPFPTLPPGISPPMAVDVEDDHGGLIVVITSICLVITLTSFGLRVFAWHIRHKVQHEDISFTFMAIVAWTQVAVVLAQVHFGWGKTASLVPPSTETSMQKTGYAADLLYVMIVGLSRITALLLYKEIFYQHSTWGIYAYITVLLSGTIASVFVLAIRCDAHPWQDITIQCESLFSRWQAIAALDIMSEIVILAYPVRALSSLHVSKQKKFILLAVFESRILLIPLCAVHLVYIHKQLYSSDPSLAGTYATVTAEIHLTISVLVQIASSLKPFIAVYEDEQGIAYTDSTQKSRSQTSSQSRPRKSIMPGRLRTVRGWELMDDFTVSKASVTMDRGHGKDADARDYEVEMMNLRSHTTMLSD